MEAERIVERLDLHPHPEGGFFAETHRGASTAIYYLVTEGSSSAMHRLGKDEVWHHYRGDALEMLLLFTDGTTASPRLGGDLDAGERPQLLVPRGTWQGARVVEGGRFALCGCTVAPPFTMGDFELGDRERLAAAYPSARDLVYALTRD